VDSYDAWFLEDDLIFQSEVSAIQQMLPTAGTGVEIGVGTSTGTYDFAIMVTVAGY
jgi:hypothetical protein